MGIASPSGDSLSPEAARAMEILTGIVREHVDVAAIAATAAEAPPLPLPEAPARVPAAPEGPRPRIGYVRDAALWFYYEENLEALERAGAELTRLSLLDDGDWPPLDGLYLGGGYPELWLRELSENAPLLKQIRREVQGGLPTLAECGGFLYLHREIAGKDGRTFPAAGVFPFGAAPAGGLRRFGYVTLTAERRTLLCEKGGVIRAHEFHYWDSDAPGDAMTAEKPLRSTRWPCVRARDSLFAGFPHLYFYANPSFAASFVRRMAERRDRKDENI